VSLDQAIIIFLMDLFVNQSPKNKKNKLKSLFFVDDSTSFLLVYLDQGCYHLTIFNKLMVVVNKLVEMVIVLLENFT
jgi:hypothetical protein